MPLAEAVLSLDGESWTYTGAPVKPAVLSVVAGGYTMPADCYTPAYSANTNAGTTATVTLTGKDNCSGTTATTFQIAKAKLTVTPEANQAQVAGVSIAKTTLKYTLTGFVNGEDKSVVTGALSWTDCDGGTGVACTSAGDFAFTTGTLAADNYSFQIAAEAPTYTITATSDEAKPTGTLPIPTEPLIAKVGYTQGHIVFPGGDWTGQWNWTMPSEKVYQPGDVGSVLMLATYAPSAAEIAKYNWNGLTPQNLPVNIALIPDTAWIQVASVANHVAIFSVKAGAWQHLNWSSAVFNDSLSLTLTPNADGTTHTVIVKGKGIYEHVYAAAQVNAEGRVITPVFPNPVQSLNPENPDSDIAFFDLHGNRVGASLVGAPPGVYILRQGSQTKKIVVR
jgi:hypothetical protein